MARNSSERFRALGTRVKDPMLLAATVVGVVVGGYLIWGFGSTRRELAVLGPRLEQVQDEHKRFEGLLAAEACAPKRSATRS